METKAGSRLRRAPRAGKEEEEYLMKREEQAEMSEWSGETGRRAHDFLRLRVRPVGGKCCAKRSKALKVGPGGPKK